MNFKSGLCATLILLACTPVMAAEKPNILIIFTDDQGYADLATTTDPFLVDE